MIYVNTRPQLTTRLLAIATVCFSFTAQDVAANEAPYSTSVVGTDFDFITTSDPSVFVDLSFVELARAEMPDKRDDDRELMQPAYVFKASFQSGQIIKLYVDSEIGSRENAQTEASRYCHPLGRLPPELRKGVNRVVIHHGGPDTTAFSDIGLIVLYSDNATRRIGTHDLEETIFHESVHAAWDAQHAGSDRWKRAQLADGNFVTTYAKRKPDREDLAETALFAYTLLRNPERIPKADRERIRKAIPNRILYLTRLFSMDKTPD